ncbi:hypothetical protein ACQP2H_29440 [Micromonospora sp. CA-248260]|uniref:hypothetical protein n=1 Tax=Micromonospora sp. CA-248260 TaxID=3239962 RepID=UPI003D8F0FD9
MAELVSAHEFAVALNASGLSTDGPVLDGEQLWSLFVDGLALLGLPEMRRLARVHLDAIDDPYDGQPSAGDRAAYRAAVRAQWGSERRLKRCMHVAVDYLAGLSRML